MLTEAELLQWLTSTNRRYGAEGVPHKGRPFRAMSDFTRENRCSLGMADALTKRIFEWFYEHSPPGSHQMGAVYTGIHFYDAAFWPVQVPLIFGTTRVGALDCLETMPKAVQHALESDRREAWAYVVHWANCMDYGYGHMDLAVDAKLHPRAMRFLGAAHSELVGANAQLLEVRPNVKAILGMRMATEIFLKAVLVQEQDLTDGQLMKLSHKIEDAASACADATKENLFDEISKRVSLYPPVSARYDNTEWSHKAVWQAAALTQLTAATVTRRYSDRDMRASIVPEEPAGS
jgi:hypothetical protein